MYSIKEELKENVRFEMLIEGLEIDIKRIRSRVILSPEKYRNMAENYIGYMKACMKKNDEIIKLKEELNKLKCETSKTKRYIERKK